MTKHKVFISYHHTNDQYYKDALLEINIKHDIFIDASVDTGDMMMNLAFKRFAKKLEMNI